MEKVSRKYILLNVLLCFITLVSCVSVLVSVEFLNLVLNMGLSFYTTLFLNSFLISILSYWIIKKIATSFNFVERFFLSNISAMLFVFCLNVFSSGIDYFNSEHRYSYKYGHFLGSMGFLIKNPLGQWGVEKIYSSLSLRDQKTFKMAEETARAYKIHKDFILKGINKPGYCHEKDLYLCYRKVLSSVLNKSIGDYSGIVLLNQIAKNYLEILNTKSHNSSYTQEQFKLHEIDLAILSHKAIIRNGLASVSLSNFPKREIASLPVNDVKRIRGVRHTSVKNAKDSYNRLIKKHLFGNHHKKNVAEALVLEEINNRKVQEFFLLTSQNLVKIFGSFNVNSNYCLKNNCKKKLRIYKKEFFKIQKKYNDLGVII